MKAGKVWGETILLLATPMIEVHRLVVLPNVHCSKHRHHGRWNAFQVSKGRLIIEVYQKDYNLMDRTEVLPGELTTVAPGLWHRFRTEEEGAECIEIYYPPVLGTNDIEREDVGSPNT